MCIVEFHFFPTIFPFIVAPDNVDGAHSLKLLRFFVPFDFFLHVFFLLQACAATAEDHLANVVFSSDFVVLVVPFLSDL